jgi:hypothetical protein
MPTTRARTLLLGGADTVDDRLPTGVIQLYVDGTAQP